MKETGKIQVFTGEGKGKTTAALGLALRAVGRGLKVIMVQFLKGPETSGEHFSAQQLVPMLTIKAMGRQGFTRRSGLEPIDAVMAERAVQEARNALLSGEYDVVILDEINVAVHVGLVHLKEVIELMEAKPETVELVLTGRYAHDEVLSRADVVLEMKKIKHHFDEGVPARKGIEY
jgi:cob(I)alamin adenosyltransferase